MALVRGERTPDNRCLIGLFLGQRPQRHLQAVAELAVETQCRRRLITAVHHAALAARVAAVTVFLPWRLLKELGEGLVMAIGDHVAGRSPAPGVVGGIGPGGAA